MKDCLKGCIVKAFLFIQKKRKNRKLLATLVIFSFFFLKWNYGKLVDRYAIFLFFHFLNKMEKMVRIITRKDIEQLPNFFLRLRVEMLNVLYIPRSQ